MGGRRSRIVRGLTLFVLAALALCAPAWAKNENYTQDYLYEDSGSWRNVQIATDWNGQTYFRVYDSEGTTSYIHEIPKDFSGNRKDLTTPYMTIPGRAGISITNDEAASYVYYTLAEDETSLYRLPLKRGYSGQPEVRDFTLEGSPFVFTGFALAKDPDQILLVSKASAQREVTIGLFSFSSWNASEANEPIRTWTCTLPEDRNYQPLITGDVGYHVVYEASTDRVWLTVHQSYFAKAQNNIPKWYFYSPFGQGGVLQAFDPASEIPKWNESTNFKVFEVGRYRRTVDFMDTTYPSLGASTIAVYEVSGGKTIFSSRVDSWTAPGGNWDSETERPLKEFWSGERDAVNNHIRMVDSRGNLYVNLSASDRSGNASFVRLARFAPDRPIEDPTPAPSEEGKTQPVNAIVLKATPFEGPEGYAATGSRWEVYQKTAKIQSTSDILSIRSYEDQEPVYVGRNTDGSSSHKLTQTLPAGDYVWRMAYDWRLGGEGGMVGSTRWSTLGSFTAVPSSNPTPAPQPNTPSPKPNSKSSGGGGCDAGFGGLALLLAASLLLGKKV